LASTTRRRCSTNWAEKPGAFELSYAVMSDAFPEVRAKFRLELGTVLEDAKLERVCD
jgi:hypothetical protein